MTVKQFLDSLPPDRRSTLATVRRVIRKHLPRGYEEAIAHGMIAYQVPLSRCPDTYNGQPLLLAGLASRKEAMSLYLMNVYADPELARWFRAEYAKSGKKLAMGKSCIRFESLDDLALESIGKAIAKTSVAKFVTFHENSRKSRRKRA